MSLFGLPLISSEPFVVCPLCGNGAGSGSGLIDDFFLGKPLVCDACGGTTDAWTAYLCTLNHPVPFLHDAAAYFVGFKSAYFQVRLAKGQVLDLRLEDYGVPAGSRLIRLNYTPTGIGVQPVELHGNEALVRRGRDQIALYGRPYDPQNMPAFGDSEGSSIAVQVCVTFASPDDRIEHAEDALSKAFVALDQNEFVDMVIPAAMAVEFSCKTLCTDFKDAVCLNLRGIQDKDLLTQVVPVIATAVGMNQLSSEICLKVGRLWGQRDSVAHTGRLHQPYARENAVMQLAAAVFTFRYLALLRRLGLEQGLVA